MTDDELDFIINKRLKQAKDEILKDLAHNHVRIDARNKLITPDQDNCLIF